jgi:hypothetical protein
LNYDFDGFYELVGETWFCQPDEGGISEAKNISEWMNVD